MTVAIIALVAGLAGGLIGGFAGAAFFEYWAERQYPKPPSDEESE